MNSQKRRVSLLLRTLGALVLALAVLAGCGTRLDSRVVQMDGRAIEVVTEGSGPSTVVFESGLGNDWSAWDAVAAQVSKQARVFAYSRPGYGESDAPRTRRDATHIVEELRALLAAQGYRPPYVLVGHSFGGAYMELFAKAHPEEVSALVLVEPRHRDFTTECEAAKIEGCSIPPDAVASLPQVQIDEIGAFADASGEIRAAGGFGSYPVRVLTGTSHASASPAWEALWMQTHQALAAEAKNGKQIVYDGAGHNLEVEYDTEVANVILELVAARRK